MVYATGGNKAGMGEGSMGLHVILTSDLTEEVAFEQSPEAGKEQSVTWVSGGSSCQAEGTASAKC